MAKPWCCFSTWHVVNLKFGGRAAPGRPLRGRGVNWQMRQGVGDREVGHQASGRASCCLPSFTRRP